MNIFGRIIKWFKKEHSPEITIDYEGDYAYQLSKVGKKYTGKITFINGTYGSDRCWYLKDGLFHRDDGSALINYSIDFTGYAATFSSRVERETAEAFIDIYYISGCGYFLNGINYKSKEEWFDALDEDQKLKAIFNMDEWR